MKRITKQEMLNLIEKRLPKGKFYSYDFSQEQIEVLDSGFKKIHEQEEIVIGCDNSSGDAFVEEFEGERSCLKWLSRYE